MECVAGAGDGAGAQGRDGVELANVGFIRFFPEWGCFLDVPTETDIARALYIATHCYGRSFLRDADPLSPHFSSSIMLDLVGADHGGLQ